VYIIETIYTKRNMRRRIYQQDEEIRELKLDIKDTIKQKDKYKESNKKLRKQIIELKRKEK
jgi:hypothetical protein